MHTTRYMIIEDATIPMDVAIQSKADLFDSILFADYDAEIMAFDLDEVLRDGATNMRKVTEDLVTEWWSADGSRDVWERVVAGKSIGLASRFYADEVAKMEARAA